MSAVTKYQVFLFVDIVGGTSRYEAVRDRKAQRMISDCLALAEQGIERHAGEIHSKMTEAAERIDRQPLRMRMGMHYGRMSEIGESCEIRADPWYFDFNGYFTEDIPGSVALCR